MESRFGVDFSQVRVHTDPQAAASAEAVHALAYTVGPHIVFGEGQYLPTAAEGQRLIAHELVHTIQQCDQPTAGAALQIDDPLGGPEREAAPISEQVLDDRETHTSEPTNEGGIQRLRRQVPSPYRQPSSALPGTGASPKRLTLGTPDSASRVTLSVIPLANLEPEPRCAFEVVFCLRTVLRGS
jgi:hypothetical protein